jgi:hypothetical protein
MEKVPFTSVSQLNVGHFNHFPPGVFSGGYTFKASSLHSPSDLFQRKLRCYHFLTFSLGHELIKPM